MRDSGLAIPLVAMFFGSIGFFSPVTALVSGDIVAAEGRQRDPEDTSHTLRRALGHPRRQGADGAQHTLTALLVYMLVRLARFEGVRSGRGVGIRGLEGDE